MKLLEFIKCLLLYPFGIFFIIPLGLLILLNKLYPQDVKPIANSFESSEPSNMFNDFAV